MAKAYWIATYRSVKDASALAEYARLASAAIAAAGGRILVRGTPVLTLEEGLDQRTVVIEFADISAVEAFYKSPAYQVAKQALGDAAVRDIRVVPGAE